MTAHSQQISLLWVGVQWGYSEIAKLVLLFKSAQNHLTCLVLQPSEQPSSCFYVSRSVLHPRWPKGWSPALAEDRNAQTHRKLPESSDVSLQQPWSDLHKRKNSDTTSRAAPCERKHFYVCPHKALLRQQDIKPGWKEIWHLSERGPALI